MGNRASLENIRKMKEDNELLAFKKVIQLGNNQIF